MEIRTAKVSQGEFTSPLGDNFKRKMPREAGRRGNSFPRFFASVCELYSISHLKCCDAEHGEARREAAWIPARSAFFVGMNPLQRIVFQGESALGPVGTMLFARSLHAAVVVRRTYG